MKFIFVGSTVTADGLAPQGTRASAGIVLTKFGSCIYVGLVVNSLRPSDAYLRR